MKATTLAVYTRFQSRLSGLDRHVKSLATRGQLTLPAMLSLSEDLKRRMNADSLAPDQYNLLERDIDNELSDLYEKYRGQNNAT